MVGAMILVGESEGAHRERSVPRGIECFYRAPDQDVVLGLLGSSLPAASICLVKEDEREV